MTLYSKFSDISVIILKKLWRIKEKSESLKSFSSLFNIKLCTAFFEKRIRCERNYKPALITRYSYFICMNIRSKKTDCSFFRKSK